MTGAILEARNLSKSFVIQRGMTGRALRHVHAVDDVSLTIQPRETLALVGESGCGKSTLGRMVMRLVDADTGQIELDGRDITGLRGRELRAIRRRIQLIFQDPFSSLTPSMTAGDIIGEPLMLHRLRPASERPARVAELLRAVGLNEPHAERYPHEFSGGQRQRVGIARALAAEPDLIVCDEPVSALDMSVQSQILNLLADLRERLGLSYLFISHDLSVVRHLANRVAVMYLGRIVEIGPAADVLGAPRHPYTRALVASAPVVDPGLRRRAPLIAGDLPNPANPPSGCHFHTRCPFSQPLCREVRPELEVGETGTVPVACHFRDTLPPADPLIVPRPARERTLNLLAAFRSPRGGEAA